MREYQKNGVEMVLLEPVRDIGIDISGLISEYSLFRGFCMTLQTIMLLETKAELSDYITLFVNGPKIISRFPSYRKLIPNMRSN